MKNLNNKLVYKLFNKYWNNWRIINYNTWDVEFVDIKLSIKEEMSTVLLNKFYT
jgi:hypothetical protein